MVGSDFKPDFATRGSVRLESLNYGGLAVLELFQLGGGVGDFAFETRDVGRVVHLLLGPRQLHPQLL